MNKTEARARMLREVANLAWARIREYDPGLGHLNETKPLHPHEIAVLESIASALNKRSRAAYARVRKAKEKRNE